MSGESRDRKRFSIARDLSSPDEEVRRLAVEGLLARPSAEAIPWLVEAMGDASWRVRKTAIERLVSRSESSQVVGALIAALSDGENPGRRNAAVQALVQSGVAVVPPLIQTLQSDDVDVRKLAVDALAGIADESARGALIDVLQDPDANVRAAAADALGVIGGGEAPRLLSELALRAQEDRLVRLSALRALARMEVPLRTADLEGVLGEGDLRPAAYALLGYSDDDDALDMLLKGVTAGSTVAREAAMAAILHRLAAADATEVERVAAKVRETAAGAEALLPRTFERLRDADLPTRLVLVQFLGLVGSPECALPILEAGRDEALAEVARSTLRSLAAVAESAIDAGWSQLDTALRTSACEVLAHGRAPEGVVRLREALDSPDGGLRAAAARALGARRCSDAMPGLVACLQRLDDDDPDCEEEREALIDALGCLGRSDAEGVRVAVATIELIAAQLEASSPSMRLSIALVLGEIGSSSRCADTELVSSLLQDPSPQVRRAAVQTLARLESGRARETLRLMLADESSAVRVAAVTALGASGEDGVLEDLRGLLRDADARTRAAALRAIGEYCSRVSAVTHDGIEMIGEALGDECPVAVAGVEALDRIGGDLAAGAACSALARPESELVQAAAQCVGRHGAADTLSELLPLVSHGSWMVRAEAIQILGERRFAQALPAVRRSLESEQHDFVRETILSALARLEE